jgi:hypothetical protein
MLDYLVGEVLLDVIVFGTLPSTNDVLSPVYACSVFVKQKCRGLLSKSNLFEKLTKEQYIVSC